MTSADRRGELEDAIAAQLKDIKEAAITETATYLGTPLSVPHLAAHLTVPGTRLALLAIRDAVDKYAQARVDEAVGAMRLQLATAEYKGVQL